jgi:hypothetical protein
MSGIRTANLGGRRKPLKSLPSDQNAEILRIRSDSTVEVRDSASEKMTWHQKVPIIWWYWTRVKAFLNLGKACLRFIGYQQFRLITWPLSPRPHRNVCISVRQVPTGVFHLPLSWWLVFTEHRIGTVFLDFLPCVTTNVHAFSTTGHKSLQCFLKYWDGQDRYKYNTHDLRGKFIIFSFPCSLSEDLT